MDAPRRYFPLLLACASILILFGGWHYLFAPPATFPAGGVVIITNGASAPEIAQELADMNIIAHPDFFRFLLRISGTSGQIHSGTYRFQSPESMLAIAYRLVTGSYGIPPVRLTFIEGSTVREMALQVGVAFPHMTKADFLRAASPYEGSLFPDTYLFSPSADAASIVTAMRDNFTAKLASSTPAIAASGHSLSDIVIMASLIEKEARTTVSRRTVAGILWNRLELGMPLQVDAVFGYIFNRETYSPSFKDLTVESPYNTYTHTGLPPGPINNPGLDAFDATINPTKTNYLYYLTGKDNLMHYATTYAGHLANQRKYLK